MRLLTNRFITTYIASSPTLTSGRRLKFPPPAATAAAPTTTSPPSSPSPPPPLQPPQQQLHLIVRDVSSDETTVESHLSWAQCLVVACARVDPESLRYAADALELRRVLRPDLPAVLVANKADLLLLGGGGYGPHANLEDCHELALRHGCLFFELSVMESPVGPRLVLMALLSELLLKNSTQQQQQQQGRKLSIPSSPAKIKLSSKRLWMKVFGALSKSLCAPPTQQEKEADKC